MEQNKQSTIKSGLTCIRKEYFDLVAGTPAGLSIRELIDHEKFSLAEYCRGYAPNRRGAEGQKAVEEFARRHKIWLDCAKHYISITEYLYPSAKLDRLISVGKAMAVDFYLNVMFGREKIGALAFEGKKLAEEIISRIAALSKDSICRRRRLSRIFKA